MSLAVSTDARRLDLGPRRALSSSGPGVRRPDGGGVRSILGFLRRMRFGIGVSRRPVRERYLRSMSRVLNELERSPDEQEQRRHRFDLAPLGDGG
jgi:hypothetical protein